MRQRVFTLVWSATWLAGCSAAFLVSRAPEVRLCRGDHLMLQCASSGAAGARLAYVLVAITCTLVLCAGSSAICALACLIHPTARANARLTASTESNALLCGLLLVAAELWRRALLGVTVPWESASSAGVWLGALTVAYALAALTSAFAGTSTARRRIAASLAAVATLGWAKALSLRAGYGLELLAGTWPVYATATLALSLFVVLCFWLRLELALARSRVDAIAQRVARPPP